jgi:hypothetical protein
MSVAEASQPSLPITGRVASSVRVRWYSASTALRCAWVSVRFGTPQDSLNGTHTMMQGWL